MKCKICNKNDADSIRYYIWVNDDDWRPFIDTQLFVEWLARSLMKHKNIRLNDAIEEYRSALISNPDAILKIIQAKHPEISEWKIVYDYVCDECQKIVHLSKFSEAK